MHRGAGEAFGLVGNYDVALAYEYKGYETHPEGKDHYYTIVNKRTGATEKIHEGDWFVKYYHKAVIVSDEEFIMKYIQLTENFRLMNGTVLI